MVRRSSTGQDEAPIPPSLTHDVLDKQVVPIVRLIRVLSCHHCNPSVVSVLPRADCCRLSGAIGFEVSTDHLASRCRDERDLGSEKANTAAWPVGYQSPGACNDLFTRPRHRQHEASLTNRSQLSSCGQPCRPGMSALIHHPTDADFTSAEDGWTNEDELLGPLYFQKGALGPTLPHWLALW